MSIPIITYTNGKCSDLWSIYIDLTERFYGKTDHTILTDGSPAPLANINFFTYANSDPFYDVWIRYFSNNHPEFFLYMQEDFFLYKPTNKKLIEFYLDIMKQNPTLSCIRLIKSGITSNSPVEGVSTLHYVDYTSDYAFSMQPSLWRTKDFLRLQETKIQITPWDEPKLNGSVLSELDMISMYHYNNEPKRGAAHYDSDVFPYIATALVKRKWNTSEYPELTPILEEYGVDVKKRGEC